MRRSLLISLALFAAASGACALSPLGLLLSDDTKSDEGEAPKSAPDAAPKAPVVTDAGGPVDAACSWFCDDFDRDPWPAAGWESPTLYGGGTIDRTSTRSLSPPRSIRSSLPANGGSGSAAVLSRTYAGSFTTIHCEVAVQIESASDEEANLFLLNAKTSTRDYVIGVMAGADTTTLLADSVVEHALPALTPRSWTRVGIDVTAGAPPKLTYNGTLANNLTRFAALDPGTSFIAATLRVGTQRNIGVGGVWSVAYDNAACEIR